MFFFLSWWVTDRGACWKSPLLIAAPAVKKSAVFCYFLRAHLELDDNFHTGKGKVYFDLFVIVSQSESGPVFANFFVKTVIAAPAAW